MLVTSSFKPLCSLTPEPFDPAFFKYTFTISRAVPGQRKVRRRTSRLCSSMTPQNCGSRTPHPPTYIWRRNRTVSHPQQIFSAPPPAAATRKISVDTRQGSWDSPGGNMAVGVGFHVQLGRAEWILKRNSWMRLKGLCIKVSPTLSASIVREEKSC